MAKCDYCGAEVSMPYTCGYCGGSFCPKHRLPENHSCEGLDKLTKESRRSGRIYRGISEDLRDEPKEKPPESFRRIGFDFDDEKVGREGEFGGGGILKNLFFSNATTALLFVIVIVYFGQLLVQLTFGGYFYENTFISLVALRQSTIFKYPWTLVTSIFIHLDFFHMFVNGLILFFIGSALERRIGRKRFIYIFLVAGILAGLAQLLVSKPNAILLGASGAIFGVLGTLTVISPRMPILLFFFIPMPLWMLTVGYGTLEAILAITSPGDTIAHMAHFSGILVGLLYGYKLRREGIGRARSALEDLFRNLGI